MFDWVEFQNGLLWWSGADCVSDWQAAIFLRFDYLGSFTYPCKKTLTSEIFGIRPQYFYTVTIHTFITQSFMNSEGLLHCTQTSFNLFSWSNTLKESWESLYNQSGWLTLYIYIYLLFYFILFLLLPFLIRFCHECLWLVVVFCTVGKKKSLLFECTILGSLSLFFFLRGRSYLIIRHHCY